MAEDPHDWEIETKAVRGGMARTPYGEMSEALFLTQSFAYPSAEALDARFSGEQPGFIYQRFGKTTTQVFEDRLALLEGAAICKATASGMAAVHAALMGLLKAGDHVVASRALFGSCRWICAELLPRFGVETTFVDATDLHAWQSAMRPNTKVVLIETPPIRCWIHRPARRGRHRPQWRSHRRGRQCVRHTLFQNRSSSSADVVVYSATKHIDGQGRVLSGAILANDLELFDKSYRDYLRHTGPALSPFSAWVLQKGWRPWSCGCAANRRQRRCWPRPPPTIPTSRLAPIRPAPTIPRPTSLRVKSDRRWLRDRL